MNKAYEIVLAGIECAFLDGSLTLGDRLPGERALAERFAVSRSSVREAIRILDAVGLIRSGVGSGPGAGSVIVSEPSVGLSRALKLHVSARHIAPADVLMTRVVLESDAVATAAEAVAAAKSAGVEKSADAEESTDVEDPAGVGMSAARIPGLGDIHLKRAEELLARMREPGIVKESFHDLDARFHRELCAAAGNPVTDIILASLSSSIVDYVSSAAAATEDWTWVQTELTKQHAGLLDSILAGDADRARRECAAHIHWFARTTGIDAAGT
ncbi:MULTISPECIES: FCD domain-containing protein [Brevibacterium]|uniref:Regulatory protein, gntR family n=1 Tax=Brevibacterium antiquum CNRZ 918 TaxID=1255637 RepID=A0A2H1JAP5_9MICO|nr:MULTISPECIES: FCD domain-containing protein [Brevibacterium]SMX84473.1 regulatory protein, gntR family [Brevibacterium antiquum CNRZ 918]HCG57074.1 FadR family transcriptional regulator [Brevibacterium sp.]